jgi:hypothetical protein
MMRRVLVLLAAVITLSAGIDAAIASAAPTPPTVTTGAATSIRPTSAVVSGTVNPSGIATTWYFEYGPNTTFVSSTPVKSAGSGTVAVSFSQSLTGLAPATSYDFRIVGENSAGTTFGGSGSFNTSVAPVVVTGAATSIRPSSAVVSGTVNPNGIATTWYFEYGPNTTFVSSTPVKSAGSGTVAVSFSQSLTGLAPATSYDFRIVGKNSAGTTFGGSGSFNTSAAPVVVTGAASNLTAHAATLNGIVNPEALSTDWYFKYGTSASYGSVTPTKTLVASPNNTNVSAGISGLVAKSTYHYRLVATSAAGTSSGADFTFSTGGISVSLNTSAPTVIYGGAVTLSGTVANGSAGDHVTIASEHFNQTAFSDVATVSTGNGGAWSYSTKPTVRTTYEATVTGGTSSAIVVSVSPAVSLREISKKRLVTRVVGAISFASHVLQLQILSNGLWVTWKHVGLNANGQATFGTRIPKGVTSIRMAIGPFVVGINQAAPGYLAGYSSAIIYH